MNATNYKTEGSQNAQFDGMSQRYSVHHGIGTGDQDGFQARVFCSPTRPKSMPKSATFWGCDSRNNLMPGRRASRSHLPLFILPPRWSVLHGIGIGNKDGCQARVFQARVFCNLTRPKSQPKSATFWGPDSRNNLMPGRRASAPSCIWLLCHKGVLFSVVLESGTKMAVKPGCFAIWRDQRGLLNTGKVPRIVSPFSSPRGETRAIGH